MAGQLDRSAFSASEFKMDLTIDGLQKTDYGFQTAVIPGMSEPTTQEFKLNNEQRTVITAPGTDNNFSFTTSFTPDFFEFRTKAKELKDYKVVLTGNAGTAFAGDKIEISGKIASPTDLSISTDNVPVYDFVGTTNYIKYTEGA